MNWAGQARLIAPLIGQEWRHHPWRLLVALLAIALGVALALAVHLINASALAEFGSAVRTLNGQPDVVLRAAVGSHVDEAAYAALATDARVAVASPVVEVETVAFDAQGAKHSLRVLGLDALVATAITPALLPQVDDEATGKKARSIGSTTVPPLLDPDRLFVNAAARAWVGVDGTLRVQNGAAVERLAVAGQVAADGAALAVIDIAGAQAHFGRLGRLSRIDLKLVTGTDRAAFIVSLAATPALAGLRAADADESTERLTNLSRAYRVNLTVLALMALFTGGFLVFSIQALAVAKRVPQLALLGVLGMAARERLRLVLAESAAIGVLGAAIGVALGTALAQLALTRLGGDLGGSVFGSSAPVLQWSGAAALACGALGVAAALVGGWLPARQAQRLAPAQSLKGLGGADGLNARTGARRRVTLPGWGPLLLLASVGLALLPPWRELPIGAYASIACLLLGGIACVPALVGAVLHRIPPPMQPVWLLAVERARDQRHSATIAVAGIVASLALSVALTVMVTSFRDSLSDWLDRLLPADLYARTATSTAQADSAFLGADFLAAAARLPGVDHVQAQRLVPLTFDAQRAPVTLIAREVGDAARALPLVGDAQACADSALPDAYASEAFVALYGGGTGSNAGSDARAQIGQPFALPLPNGRRASVCLRAIWRDYARQQGALIVERSAWRALSGDDRVNDLALWLQPGADVAAVQQGLRGLAVVGSASASTATSPSADLLEIATPAYIRSNSLTVFDRSFAVTYWLQAVAIAIGLAGIAASFSAQVLARRREFGALLHLGMARRTVLVLVCAEAAVWSAVGTALGLVLGLGISVVLVKVVNPQSFHWTMDLSWPFGRLALLAGAVLASAIATAWIAGRAAASHDMALAVKEDW